MKHIKALDGLKGFSIIAIILYHLWPQYVPGGFLTVNLFLVVAGYFMANKFASSDVLDDRRAMGQTLKKTIARIWFPLLWLLIWIVIGLLLFNPDLLKSMQNELLASLFFLNNAFQLASQKSYFTDMAIASPLTHLWYIAIYVQSFLVSLPLLWLCQRKIHSNNFKAIIWLLIFAACCYINYSRYIPHADPSPVYYSLLTRYASFAMGIATFYLIPVIKQALQNVTLFEQRLFYFLMTLGSFILMITLILKVDDQSPDTYQVWLPYYNLLAAYFIIGAQQQFVILERLIGNPILSWFGKRSYSFYLWYYPVIVYGLNFSRDFQSHVDWLKALILVGILITGYAFYLFFESKRFDFLFGSNFNFKENGQKLTQALQAPLTHLGLLSRLLFFIICMSYFVTGLVYADNKIPLALLELEYGLYRANPAPFYPYPFYQVEGEMKTTQQTLKDFDQTFDTHFLLPSKASHPIEQAFKEDIRSSVSADLTQLSENNQTILAEVANLNPDFLDLLESTEIIKAYDLPVTLFGDSLAKLTGYTFSTLFTQSETYGYPSMDIWHSYDRFQALLDEGLVADTLVINLGTNSGLDDEGMDQLIAMAGDREIYFVNTNSAVQHVDIVNDCIKTAAKKYPNVHEVDWHSLALGHPEYYMDDDIHLSLEGEILYTATVAKAIYQQSIKP